MEQLTYQNTIPVKYRVNVLVAGGGPAGMAAAVSAAKTGASVYVAERAGAMGGMSTAGLVPAFSQYSDGIHNLVGGVGTEILERLREMGGTGDEGGFSIRPEVLKRLYDQMLLENGVQFTFHTALVDVQQQEGHVCYAILHGKSGLFAVQADAFVDCTGDGDLAVLAGAQYEKGDENGKMMPGALCSHWHGIDWTVADRDPTQRRMLEQAFADGVFSVQDLSLPGIWKTGETTGGGNVGRCFGVDGTDEVSVTSAYVEMRRRLVEYERYYREYLHGFEHAEMISTGALMGIRETRRIVGDYRLNLEDFKNRAVFDDEIGRYNNFVDIHLPTPDHEQHKKHRQEFMSVYKYGKGESFGIPYRSLLPVGLDNVWTAGRCISCDRYILGSLRVMPGCFITGQAAGAAAAIAAKAQVTSREVPIKQLQQALLDIGAYLPNFKQ